MSVIAPPEKGTSSMNFEAILKRFRAVRSNGNGWTAARRMTTAAPLSP
jgi:hypothetical protein